MPNITTNHAIIWHKYQSWYFKIVSNFSRQKITCNNLEISLLVFEPNITTNHAITYTYYKQIKWNFDGSRLPLHSRKRLKATVSGLKKNGRHEEKGRKTTILNRSRNKCNCTQMIFIALTAAITHGYNKAVTFTLVTL